VLIFVCVLKWLESTLGIVAILPFAENRRLDQFLMADTTTLASIESASDHIEPEQVADRLLRGDASLMLVDVRAYEEYEQFHIRGAENVPVSEVLNKLELYRNHDTIVLYSNGMTHPAQARDILAMHGFTNVYQMTDGLQPFPDDIRLAKCGGIRGVVNLRFEDELDWNEKEIVQSTGLEYHNVPFKAPETLTDAVFDKTGTLLKDEATKPLLLHCDSANRVGAIWLAHRVLDDGLTLVDAEKEAKSVGLKSPDYLTKAKDYIARLRKSGP